MLRLSLPGGHLASAQFRRIAKIAAEQGRGFADLTPFQEIQIPGVPPDPPPELFLLLEEAGLPSQAPSAALQESRWDPIGVLEQEQAGLFTVGVPVLAGRLSADQMRKAADVAERYGNGSLRLTYRQNLLIPDVPKEKVTSLLEGLDGVGLKVSASALRRGLVCCAADKSAAIELVEYLEKQVLLAEPLSIHLSDAPCSCPQAASADLCLQVGDPCEASAGSFVMRGIPPGRLKFRLERLLFAYKRRRQVGEPFLDFCRRLGDEEMAHLLSNEVPSPST